MIEILIFTLSICFFNPRHSFHIVVSNKVVKLTILSFPSWTVVALISNRMIPDSSLVGVELSETRSSTRQVVFLRESNMIGIVWKYCDWNAYIYIYPLNHIAQPAWFRVCYFANGIIFCDFFFSRNENITIGFICFIHSECKAVNVLQLLPIINGDVLRPVLALYPAQECTAHLIGYQCDIWYIEKWPGYFDKVTV